MLEICVRVVVAGSCPGEWRGERLAREVGAAAPTRRATLEDCPRWLCRMSDTQNDMSFNIRVAKVWRGLLCAYLLYHDRLPLDAAPPTAG